MPTVLVGLMATVVCGLGAFMLKYLMRISGILGRLETKQDNDGARITSLENWRNDSVAENVAYRNGYNQKPRPRFR